MIKLPGVPEGYEAVRIGQAVRGEQYVNHVGSVITRCCDYPTQQVYLIVRPIAPVCEFPDIFLPGWLTQDEDGEIRWHDKKPDQPDPDEADFWSCCSNITMSTNMLKPGLIKFRDDLPWYERIVQVGEATESNGD